MTIALIGIIVGALIAVIGWVLSHYSVKKQIEASIKKHGKTDRSYR